MSERATQIEDFIPMQELRERLDYKDNISVRRAFDRASVPLTRISHKRVGATVGNLQRVLQHYTKQKVTE